jgi:hypothetical protein
MLDQLFSNEKISINTISQRSNCTNVYSCSSKQLVLPPPHQHKLVFSQLVLQWQQQMAHLKLHLVL